MKLALNTPLNRSLLIGGIFCTVLLSGCAQSYKADEYDVGQLGESQQIYTVKILSVHPVTIKNDTGTKGDAGVGALAGGVFGNVVGGNSTGTAVGAAAGGAIGGMVGAMHTDKGVLIKYKDVDGGVKSMTEMGDAKDFKKGSADETIFVDAQGKQQIRIMPNNKQVKK